MAQPSPEPPATPAARIVRQEGLRARIVRAMGDDRRGFALDVTMGLLTLASGLYYLGCGARRCAYQAGLIGTRNAGVPVVSIGNLTAGGTGKTPMVAEFARRLRAKGLRSAILRRGYGSPPSAASTASAANAADPATAEDDETRVLRAAIPDVPIYVGPDRVASAAKAVVQGADCLLLDDGFQHWRIERDLDVVLLDATCPFGFEHLLPRGLLREPLSALRRAGAIAITRADQVADADLDGLRKRIESLAPGVPIATARHRPGRPLPVWPNAKDRLPPEDLAGRKVVAVSAIGNPESFAKTLASAGAEVAAEMRFDDHHIYTGSDVEAMDRACAEASAPLAVVTAKDAVKLAVLAPARTPVASLPIEIEFLDGEEAFFARVWRVLRPVSVTDLDG